MRRAGLPLLALAAACGPDATTFQLRFELQRGDSYTCSSDSCASIGMHCDAAMLVRIVDAEDEDVAYLQQCAYVEANGELCELGNVELDSAEIPNRPVRIQVAVWSQDEIAAFDPSLRDARECPATAFNPISGAPALQPSPALWGQTYFAVGTSSLATVTLNCGDLGSLDTEVCQGTGRVHVTTHVDEFNQLLPVSPAVELTVSMGEPRSTSFTENIQEMQGTLQGTFVSWTGDRVLGFLQSACIQVVGSTLQAASTLHCVPVSPEDVADGELSADGVYIDKSTIDKIEQAVGSLPTSGVVIGKVVDSASTPVEGAVVMASSPGTITYLSADMTGTVPSATSSSGVFVSKDVKYYEDGTDAPTTWTANVGGVTSIAPVIGGTVMDNVTIVILRMPEPMP